ncbi:MAG: ribosome recycling factor [Clostridia bacterium]|nr:ribosome recycling factor [Clostridia bacterium]MBQ6838866.1 ribosome recycling factor [Clostridia bacterium]
MNTVFATTKERMEKSINSLKYEYNSIRAGRANAAILDRITVDYYGSPTPINQMAAISVPEARVLAIQPWDMSALSLIEKAILASDIGINPSNDGRIIRLVFPALTEERRKQLSKDVSKYAEDAKVAVRQIRRDSIEKIKTMKKNSEITEDDQKYGEEELQKITDDFVKRIDEIAAAKTKEIMEI